MKKNIIEKERKKIENFAKPEANIKFTMLTHKRHIVSITI